jgi:site-specific DNA recombinase
VSTNEQARSGYSLAQQIESLREFAAREGYEILEEITDPGQSGASLERPGMDRVRNLVQAGGVSIVLAQDRDRFVREPAYHYLLRREFEEHGTKLQALNARGDDSPEGELTNGILDQLAKYERAKIAERTRRGKLLRAREGKIILVTRPNFGFKYNAARDNYIVDEEQMRVIRRIFYMVGVEGISLHGVGLTFEREGVPTPTGKRVWGKPFVRSCILHDVYKPHSYAEIEPLVSGEVAARLDPEKRYGIWWFNRERVTLSQVAESADELGRRYRRRVKRTSKPASEWIAVPVPESGVSREWVDAARGVLENNERTSKNGGRFWELSGGILCCASCRWNMKTATVTRGNSPKRSYYYRCSKRNNRYGDCPNRKNHRADNVEPRVWDFVSGLLKNPQQLHAGLEEMVQRERGSMRGDPDREAKAWADKLVEVERQRERAQEAYLAGAFEVDELRAKLATLEVARDTARKALAALEVRREQLAELERDRDALLERYAEMMPEAIDALTPERRHHIYKLLRIRVSADADGALEMSGVLGEEALEEIGVPERDATVCKTYKRPWSTTLVSSSKRTSRRSPTTTGSAFLRPT